MNKNIGCVDKVMRLIVGAVAIYLGITVSPWFYIVAAVAIITALIGWCGLYTLLGINTGNKGKK